MYIAVVSRKLHQDGRMRADHGLLSVTGGGWTKGTKERRAGERGRLRQTVRSGRAENEEADLNNGAK